MDRKTSCAGNKKAPGNGLAASPDAHVHSTTQDSIEDTISIHGKAHAVKRMQRSMSTDEAAYRELLCDLVEKIKSPDYIKRLYHLALRFHWKELDVVDGRAVNER